MRGRETAALLFLAAVWGASFLFIRIAAPVMGPFALMVGRVLLAALVLWAYAALRQIPLELRRWWRQLLLLGLVHAALPFALIAAAEVHLTASMAAVLLGIQPLFVMLLGALWLGERLSPLRLGGLLLGLAGVVVVVGWDPSGLGDAGRWSAAAVVAAALSYAAGSLYARHRMGHAPVVTLALGQQLGAAAWLIVPALFTAPATAPTARALWALVALAVLSTSVAYLVFFWLIGRVGAVRSSTVTYLIPVFGLLWGAMFLGEPLTPGILTGLGCILASLMLVNRTAQTKSDPAPEGEPEALAR